MARKVETRIIGDTQYTVKALGGRLGAEGLRRLGATAGPAIAAAVATMRPGGVAENLPALLGGAAGLIGKLREEDFSWFCTEFGKVSTTKVNDKIELAVDPQFDELFSANYMDLVEWLGLCLSVNYGDFIKDAFGKLTTAMAAADASPPPAG